MRRIEYFCDRCGKAVVRYSDLMVLQIGKRIENQEIRLDVGLDRELCYSCFDDIRNFINNAKQHA